MSEVGKTGAPAEKRIGFLEVSPLFAHAQVPESGAPGALLIAEERTLPGPGDCQALRQVGRWFLTAEEPERFSWRADWEPMCVGTPGSLPICPRCAAYRRQTQRH
jgi:hypothetical protein